MSSGTPPISNMIRPGLTTATQWSGAPLPEPIRTSAGFLVTGLSGKTRIQIRPPRLTWCVIARRAASIWRLVSQQTSSAISPKSPKLTSVPPLAIPARRPRWTFRCLTRFGINIGQASSAGASGASGFSATDGALLGDASFVLAALLLDAVRFVAAGAAAALVGAGASAAAVAASAVAALAGAGASGAADRLGVSAGTGDTVSAAGLGVATTTGSGVT